MATNNKVQPVKNMESLEIQSNNVEDYVEDATALSSRKGKSQTLSHF